MLAAAGRLHASGVQGRRSLMRSSQEEDGVADLDFGQSMSNSMACHLLPESGSIWSAADELFENQRAEQGIYWTQWDSRLSDDLKTASIYSDNPGNNGSVQSLDTSEHCSTVPSDSDEQHGYPTPFEPLHMEQTNDMFLSQFSDEDVRRMDAPFQSLDMFPDSMHRLMSYEHMLGGALMPGGSLDQEPNMDQDDMDTCGFPLYFSHGLQDAGLMEPTSMEMVTADTSSIAKVNCSCPAAVGCEESSPGSEEPVLEELEEVMVQMARTTRICLRDAFYRLAESSMARRRSAAAEPPRASTRPRRRQRHVEREENAIDRTVVSLTLRPPACLAAQLHASEAEAMQTKDSLCMR